MMRFFAILLRLVPVILLMGGFLFVMWKITFFLDCKIQQRKKERLEQKRKRDEEKR